MAATKNENTLPFTVDPDEDTICDVIRRWAEVQPDAPALIEEGKDPLTYCALVAVMDDIRRALNASGFGREARIAVVHSGGADMALILFGIMSGATGVPFDPRLTAHEFRNQFRERNVEALIIEPGVSQTAAEAAQELGIVVLETHTRTTRGDKKIEISVRSHKKPDPPSTAQSEDVALVFGTSGTTGSSKIVAKNHGQHLANYKVRAYGFGIGPDDVNVLFRPLYYAGPFANVAEALFVGGSVVVLPSFEPAAFFRCVAAYGVTWYTAGPTFHRAIFRYVSENPEVVRGINLRQIRVSSASLEPEIVDDLERIFAASVETSYALSETGHLALSCKDKAPRKEGTAGVAVDRLGLGNTKVQIRSLEGGFAPPGVCGEIVIRGDQVFDGYENDDEANAEAFIDGWFRTGDEGFLDEDGYLTLTGRIKEMINRGGEKVSPAEVDAALMAHADVREVATFPIPHPTLGEEVAAAVVQTRGAALTDQVLTDYLLKFLSGFKVPRRFVFVDEIPKSDAGKVQRYRLAEMLGVEIEPGQVRGGPPDRDATPLEARLQGLWAKALGLSGVGLEDNFFLLGGDSLQAVELFLAIEKELGQRLPRAALFEAGTVTEMARLIEDDRPSSCIVPIQDAGRGAPFFCVHDGNGDVLIFRDLAKHMGKDRPFYGIQCVGLDGKEMPFTRIEDMAAHYIKEIRRVRLTGPYFIGGYSFGGRVAYVMAQKLWERGELGLLALLDTAAQSGKRRFSWRYWAIRHVTRLKTTPISELPSYMAMRFENIVTEIRRATLTRLYGCAISCFRSRGKVVPQWLYRPIEANDLIRRTTRLTSFAGDAVLFRTTAEAGQSDEGRVSGWRSLIEGNLEITPISGQHFQIVKEPHVRDLASKLVSVIEAAEG